jgi:replication initiation protein RepC
METHAPTTPFGRRTLTLAHVATQMLAKSRPADKVVHKWILFRAICTAKLRLGVSDRALSVLNALLTFHPDTTLGGDDLIVFPSNAQLSLRAHGMTPATLRRHVAVLVDAGLVCRRDSPNGKRYVRRNAGGDIEIAFGFDLSPLVARADEIEALADAVAVEDRALKLARERITLCRRDIAKMIETAVEEDISSSIDGQGFVCWSEAYDRFRAIVERIPRSAPRPVLEGLAAELSELADEILNLLEYHANLRNLSANAAHTERHIQNSNPDTSIDSEPSFQESRAEPSEASSARERSPNGSFPLGMVIDACPDVVDYARGGIANWRDLLATMAVVRPVLGISPSAWDDACSVMGEQDAAVVVAAILQRSDAIGSAGGYLRALTRKAEGGEFSAGPMLMALLASRRRERMNVA